MYNKHY